MQTEYTLLPHRQEFSWSINDKFVVYGYILTCVSFNLAILAAGESLDKDTASYVSVVAVAVVTGLIAISQWLIFLAEYLIKRIAKHSFSKYPRTIAIVDGRIEIRRGGNALAFNLMDLEEICLVKKHDSVLSAGSGLGIRATESSAKTVESVEQRSRLIRNLKKYGYQIWFDSAEIGDRAQVFEFWKWINATAVGATKCERNGDPKPRAKRQDWILAVIATIWTAATIIVYFNLFGMG